MSIIQILGFWTSSEYWVKLQYFDPFFKGMVIASIVMIIVPVWVKKLLVKHHSRKEKIHESDFGFWSGKNIGTDIKGMDKAMFLMVYMDYLLRIGQSLNEVEFRAARVWNKHVHWHVSTLLLITCYLSIGTDKTSEMMVHQLSMFIFCTVLTVPLFSNAYWFFKELRAESNRLEMWYRRISEVTIAYKENGEDGVNEFIDKKFHKD